jgi:mono/diheme cytochrome c family protein
MFPFSIPKDKDGDSTNYVAARQVPNPFTTLDSNQIKEAERLYLINCGICHGPNLDGNGPLYNEGKGPYPAAPKNLVGDPVVSNMPEGQLFYSVTYGKGQMGPYASNLHTDQRWMVVHYVKMKQLEKKGGGKGAATGAGADSTSTGPTGGKGAGMGGTNSGGVMGSGGGTSGGATSGGGAGSGARK